MRVELTSRKNVFAPRAKNVSIPLGLTAAASVIDTATQNNFLDQG